MVGHGGSSAGSYLADPTSPIPSHCASIVVTCTLRVTIWLHFSSYMFLIIACTEWWVVIFIADVCLFIYISLSITTSNSKTDDEFAIIFPPLWFNSYSASHNNWCSGTLLNRIITAQWEGMGDVGSARYEPALLPPCPTIRVLSYSNCQISVTHSISKWLFRNLAL